MDSYEMKYWTLAVVIIIMVGGFAFAMSSQPTISSWERSNATMTVNGQFDRVELLDRHFGDFNGIEVVDEQVAVAYENGTVSIANTHYEGGYQQTYKNFGFLLRIYWGVHHLPEKIDVMGGASEEYVFLNITIVVSLEGILTEDYVIDNVFMAGLLTVATVALIAVIAWNCRPGRNDSSW